MFQIQFDRKLFAVLFRLGSSEVEQVQRVVDGVQLLIEMEKRLEVGELIVALLLLFKKLAF